MAGRVFQHRVAGRLLSRGQAEHSIYWHDDATGVRLRCRPDFITEGLGRTICIDYKTATSANPRQFQRAVQDYGYHCQQAFYEDGLAEIGLTDVGFLFVVQSKTAPFTVSVCQIEPADVELGRRQNRAAIERFARLHGVRPLAWLRRDPHRFAGRLGESKQNRRVPGRVLPTGRRLMSAGFEVRNHSVAMEAMFTIQVLVDPGYAEIDVDAAQRALTAAYASATYELSKRVEAARAVEPTTREAPPK